MASNSVSDGLEAITVSSQQTRACTNCVRAKAKCSTTGVMGQKCDRCIRMKKNCQPSPPMRKRRAFTRSASKTSKLEEKVDGLVTLLKSATQSMPAVINNANLNTPPESIVLRSHRSDSSSVAANSVDYQDHAYKEPVRGESGSMEYSFTPPATSSRSWSPSQNLQPSLQRSIEPSSTDAESYLRRFQTYFVRYLPFIVIPPSVTASQLRQERPFLWLSVMCVASCHTTQQLKLSKELRGIFGREAYFEGTRNMDLLLAVLVYGVWGRSHCFEKLIMTSLSQLAIAILYDLGLDRAASRDSGLAILYDLKGTKKPASLSTPHTMEERRALLGCFLLSSVPSYMGKGGTLRWTGYADECLRMLDIQKEVASDALLVQIVKLRLIAQRVIESPWSTFATEVDLSGRPAATFYLKSMMAQLQDLKASIPKELADDKTLQLQLHNTEFTLYEIGLSQIPGIFNGEYNRRFECLFACLNAAKSWIDVFFSIPPAQYIGFSALIYANMMHSFVDLYRLSTFENPEWNRGLVSEILDVSYFLEQTEKNLMLVKDEAGFDPDGSDDVDSFTYLATKTRSLKLYWDRAQMSAATTLNTTPSEEPTDFPVSFFDDDWLNFLSG
ncbi:zn 2cys6 transcription factor [Phlyctema vagabunda]|uniref:Zn 2cys6 transcription factor n=1 Tax=Phlyctema vagabunda TaxID=108571 RepID=A0ABR4PS22_9HELO